MIAAGGGTLVRGERVFGRGRRLALMIGAALAVAHAPASAQGQTGMPAFRVPLKVGSTDPGVPSVYTWLETVSSCSTTCGTGTRTTTYQCQNVSAYDWQNGGYGMPEPSSACTFAIGPAPADKTESCVNYSSCSYDWVAPSVSKTATPPGRVGCGQVRSQFDPYCRRSDGVVLAQGDHALCSADRPDYDGVAAGNPDALGFDRTAVETSACNASDHQWKVGAWGAPSSTCSTTATSTRSVVCERKFDSAIVADAECGGGRPETSNTEPVYSSCSYTWKTSEWSAYSSTCSTSATRTRSVTCERSNGDAVEDAQCGGAGAKPAASETSPQYGSCGYSAGGAPTYSSWDSSCSDSTTRHRRMQCVRSNDGGQIVPDAECTSRGVDLEFTETGSDHSLCGYAWQTGEWSGPSSTCSAAAQQTRSVWCQRSDGKTVADGLCQSGSRPAASQTVAEYSGCGYGMGGVTSYGPWSSTCSSTATRPEYHSCMRSDGATVANGECSSRGIGLTTTSAATAVYDGCGYAWQTGGWSGPSSTCSAAAQQTRSVYCQRGDGSVAADASCPAASRPASSQPAPTYTSCGYSAGGTPTYTSWDSSCSGNASRYRRMQCVRSNDGGQIVPEGECTSRGVALEFVESGSDYSLCGFSMGGVTSYGAWSSTCASNATRPENHACVRSDGMVVAASECTSRNVGLITRSAETAVYDGCGYTPTYGSYSTCSNGTQSAPMTGCTRSDGAGVATSFCTGAGHPASVSQSCAQAAPGIGFYIGITQAPQGSPQGGSYYAYQTTGPALGALPANRQRPYYACSYYGYTINEGDEFDGQRPSTMPANTCYEFVDGNTTSPPTVIDGAGYTRTIYWRKP